MKQIIINLSDEDYEYFSEYCKMLDTTPEQDLKEYSIVRGAELKKYLQKQKK